MKDITFDNIYEAYENQTQQTCLDTFIYDFQEKRIEQLKAQLRDADKIIYMISDYKFEMMESIYILCNYWKDTCKQYKQQYGDEK